MGIFVIFIEAFIVGAVNNIKGFKWEKIAIFNG
jgi:hypothetical protein